MEGNLSKRPRWAIAPDFIVDDVVTTANYYRDKLGFHYERFWGEPPCFCMVTRSGIVAQTASPIRRAKPGERRRAVEFKSQGVTITRDICDQPYGCSDFDIEDCNGYRLCFGQNIEG